MNDAFIFCAWLVNCQGEAGSDSWGMHLDVMRAQWPLRWRSRKETVDLLAVGNAHCMSSQLCRPDWIVAWSEHIGAFSRHGGSLQHCLQSCVLGILASMSILARMSILASGRVGIYNLLYGT